MPSISCSCQGHCRNGRCRCYQSHQSCNQYCVCAIPQFAPCYNPCQEKESRNVLYYYFRFILHLIVVIVKGMFLIVLKDIVHVKN